MTRSDLLEAVEANPSPAAAGRSTADADALAIEMLDGDEVIQLSIKPSLWFVPIASANVVAAAALVAGAAFVAGSSLGWFPLTLVALQLAILGAVLRVAFASLQWASQLYLLTNRRVMTVRGVLTVRVSECRLSRLADARLHAEWFERPLRLGTVCLVPVNEDLPTMTWSCLARPREVHDALVRAIRRAR